MMSLYGVALMPLASQMHEEFPTALQPWYADDAGAVGAAQSNAACLDFLMKWEVRLLCQTLEIPLHLR